MSTGRGCGRDAAMNLNPNVAAIELIAMLLLVGALLVMAGTSVAPLIYALF